MTFKPTEKAWLKSTLFGLSFKLVTIIEPVDDEYKVDSGVHSKACVPKSTLFKRDDIERVMRLYDDEIEKLKEAKVHQFNLMRWELSKT